MMLAIFHVLEQSFLLFAIMAPYLLLGILAAGVMHVLLPVDFISKRLGRNSFASVLKAGALGIPIPLCSCGVVPVAASLKKNGASNGATVSFLVTTPTSGVDSIFATYSLLGWPIMMLRVAASFLLGIAAGLLTAMIDKDHAHPPPAPKPKKTTPKMAVKTAITYAFTELYEGISKPLLIGSLLGGLVAYFLPANILTNYAGDGLWGYLIMLAIGIPLYVCASGSIPLAAALLAKGISPGAALVFLIAGPATNAATVAVISNMLGKKTLAVYLFVLTIGTLGVGLATDLLFDVFNLPLLNYTHLHEHSSAQLNWLEIVSAIGLLSLSLYYILVPLIKKITIKKGDSMIEFTVNDMTCQHCAKNIENAVYSIQGIKSVHADPANKKVIIDAQDKLDNTTRELLKDAISKAGYHPE